MLFRSSVDTGTRKITVTNGNNMTANIVATIDSVNPGSKGKTFVSANSAVQTSGGTSIFANNSVITYVSQGQVHIAANNIIKTPDTPQSLFTSDVVSLISVLDFNNTAITTANASGAVDVTSRYSFNNGQKDSYYDHAFIKLKPGYTAPTGQIGRAHV